MYGINYCYTTEPLVKFIGSDWGNDIDDHKSTLGYVFHLRSRPLVWLCKERKVVPLSTIQAKYHGDVNVGREGI